MRKELSLYIHIPFCTSRCNYCSFVSEVAGPARIGNYVECLIKEIKMRAKEYNPKFEIRTIFIGGGTPSSLPIGMIKKILHTVYTSFTVQNNAEISIEINPNNINQEKIDEYLMSGINRFSIGLQCAQHKLLKEIGRTHSFDQFVQAIEMLKSSGANNISSDIMIGLPNQSIDDIKETLYKLIELEIPHISSYMLQIEPNTKMYDYINAGVLKAPSDKDVVAMYKTVVDVLKANDYTRYEVSNFSKPGHRSKHNLVYWSRKPYLGLGVSSHSYIDNVRFSNAENISEYMSFLEEDKIPLESYEELSVQDRKEEFVMLSLRLKEGIDCNEYERLFESNILTEKNETIKDLIKNKFLILDSDNHLRATDNGFLVLNRIILLLTE